MYREETVRMRHVESMRRDKRFIIGLGRQSYRWKSEWEVVQGTGVCREERRFIGDM